MKQTITGVFVIPFMFACSSAGDGGDSPAFGEGCTQEFNDGPGLFVADCSAAGATWEDFDESCYLPATFEALVTDESGNVVDVLPNTFHFALPNVPGAYDVVISAPGYELVEESVCLTAYDGCHVTEHFCDETVDLNDFDSHYKPFLLIDLTPAGGLPTARSNAD